MRIPRVATDSKQVRALILFAISFACAFLVDKILTYGGYYNPLSPHLYDFRYLPAKYLYYASFITGIAGGITLFGDLEKEIDTLIGISLAYFLVIDMGLIIDNVRGLLHSLI